jgi:RNA polymerase sigma-70 factor (ECF subfamily)
MNATQEFPKTTWGLVCRIRDPNLEEYRAGIETLCRRYWEPIHQYAQAAWATKDLDAQDLTQDFFLWLLEGEALKKYDPERASFRLYLKGLLRNFGRNARTSAKRLKRGGGVTHVTLDDEAAKAFEPADERTAAAEAAFDRAWVNEVTRLAVERVRDKVTASPRAVQWQVFEDYDLKPEAERPTYAALAGRYGVKESDVRNWLFAVRQKVRDAIRGELTDTVRTPSELESELRHVVAS